MPPDSLTIDWQTKRELKKVTQSVVVGEDETNVIEGKPYLVSVVDVTVLLPDIGAETGQWTVAGLVHAVAHEPGSVSAGENEIFTNEQPVLDAYRTMKIACDHCQVNRHRVRTLVCREVKSGRMIQVGVECAMHYVRNAAKDVDALEFQELVTIIIKEFTEGDDGWGCENTGHRLMAFDASEVVSWVVRVVRDANGYQPSNIKTRDGEELMQNPHATWRTVERKLSDLEPLGPTADDLDVAAYGESEEYLASIAALTPEQLKESGFAHYQAKTRAREASEALARWQETQPTKDDEALAGNVLAWLSAAVVTEWPVGREPTYDERQAAQKSDFLRNLKATFSPGWVSSKKLPFAACVTRAYDRAMEDAKRLANPPSEPAPEGRVTVEGEIITIREQSGEYGTVWKMLVRLGSGAKVWCSIPAEANAVLGQTIKFTATFQRSDKDQFFAFGKIPKLWKDKPSKGRKLRSPQTELAVV
jgi:hypothetical protein